MTRPKYVEMASHNIRIIWNYIFTEDTDNCGQIHHEHNRILISKLVQNQKRPETQIATTLFHELLHKASNIFAYENELTENSINAIAELLTQAFVSNPDMGKYFVELAKMENKGGE
jgi:hypothetical protein